MPYSVVAEKLKAVPDFYLAEVSEFLDFILFKSGKENRRNGLDEGAAALYALNRSAQEGGTAGMSEKEIEAEIAACRAEKGA